jgi:non-specific protein-tyrosine kinase
VEGYEAPDDTVRTEGAGVPGIRDYVQVLNRRRLAIIAFVVIAVGVALASSLTQTARYEARAELLIEQRQSEQDLDGQDQQVVPDQARVIETEVRVVESPVVRDAVEERFGPDTPSASVSTVTGTNLVAITVTSTDPDLAAAVANDTARAYIVYRQDRTRADYLDAGQTVQSQIAELRNRIVFLDTAIARSGDPEASAGYAAERDSARNQVGLLQSQLDTLNLKASLATGDASLVAPAEVPDGRSSPQPVSSAILAGIAGLILGVLFAFALELFDDRVDSVDALTQVLPSLPVLGMVPVLSGWSDRRSTHIACIERPTGPVAEAFRSLRTALQFVSQSTGSRIIQVTSSMPGEGKSSTTANLAVMFALTGARTVVVDADLRRPRLHHFFGIGDGPGLTSALLRDAEATEVLRTTDVAGLMVVPAGPPTPFPAELLGGDRMSDLLDALAEVADVVLVDSPPVLPVADPIIIAGAVDTVVVVASARGTTRRNLLRTIRQLSRVGASISGLVLNEAVEPAAAAYGGYYRDETETLLPRWMRRGERDDAPTEDPAYAEDARS